MAKKKQGDAKQRAGHVHVIVRDDNGQLLHQSRRDVDDVDAAIAHLDAGELLEDALLEGTLPEGNRRE